MPSSFNVNFALDAMWHCNGCRVIHGEATGMLSFTTQASDAQLSLTGSQFTLQSSLSLKNKAEFSQGIVVTSQLVINGEPLTVMGSQISGGLFRPAGTEIGITLGHQKTLGGVGVMAIGKKVAN